MPIAPGTWGSLPPAVVLGVMGWWSCSALSMQIVMLIWLLYGCLACICLAPAAIAATNNKDPGEVVADEVAGQALCFLLWLCLPVDTVSPRPMLLVALGGFLLFRLFDIIKPFPARQFEKFPKGWGILADDLMAGVYAGLLLWIVTRLSGVCFMLSD